MHEANAIASPEAPRLPGEVDHILFIAAFRRSGVRVGLPGLERAGDTVATLYAALGRDDLALEYLTEVHERAA